jgi:hypothetical protein
VPVYIDNARHVYGRMQMGHMIADTPEELHLMADKIGLRREWFQPRSFPHYDVSISRRNLAVKEGAIQCDRNTFGKHLQRIKASEAFTDRGLG